jgi:hypothetical protein
MEFEAINTNLPFGIMVVAHGVFDVANILPVYETFVLSRRHILLL